MNAETQAPPAAAFLGTPEEEAEIDRRLRLVEQQEGKRVRKRKWVGKAGWGVAALFGVGLVAQAVVTASLFPLKEIRHQFTLLREDGTAQALRSSWDLPESKREQLIQATAVRYTQNCESWSWVSASAQYDFCAGLSQGRRQTEYLEAMDPDKNPRAPQTLYGRTGVVRIIPTGVRRMAPNSIRVMFIRVETKPDTAPIITRHVATQDYVPVQELPADLRMTEPVADILFIRSEIATDPTPLDLNPDQFRQEGTR